VRVVAFDAGPQAAHVHIDGAWVNAAITFPDQLQNLSAIEYAVRRSDKEAQQLELAEEKMDFLAVDENLVGVEVDPQPPLLVHLANTCPAAPLCSDAQ
jgi:hypothetical protein